ncbi:hypothetical protein K435DRAFT_861368 [Dendrothele bispora CBS 962.96]|uniref:Uncharacterized protein n=1 Tax=Dendrothele bispora (strain CBS 962.96) TaxID=1314807 RepID=A0A4S8LVD0_DENBC|nr:hypothetical protein K435DRAFT_861368 [Dendrothele bispora CBS 962.96]
MPKTVTKTPWGGSVPNVNALMAAASEAAKVQKKPLLLRPEPRLNREPLTIPSSSSSSSETLPVTITISAPVEKNPSTRSQSVLNGDSFASSSPLSRSTRTRRQVNSTNAVTEPAVVLPTPTTAITTTESSTIPIAAAPTIPQILNPFIAPTSTSTVSASASTSVSVSS